MTDPPPTHARIVIRKEGSLWHYATYYKQGGSSASSNRGTLTEAVARAELNLSEGEEYELTINGKMRGIHHKGEDGRERERIDRQFNSGANLFKAG